MTLEKGLIDEDLLVKKFSSSIIIHRNNFDAVHYYIISQGRRGTKLLMRNMTSIETASHYLGHIKRFSAKAGW